MSHNITFQLAKQLALLGNKQGFTVKTLASHAKVSTSTIYGILGSGNKAYNPKIGTLQKIAKAFKVPMTNFFDFSQSRRQRGTAEVSL